MAKDEDRLLRALACLPPIATDIERDQRVQKRCHAALTRQVSRRAPDWKGFGNGLLDFAAAAGLCVYFAAMLRAAVRLGGSL